MPEPQASKFEGWAIVEIMGHQRVAGYVSTEAFGATVMFRVITQELPPTEVVLDKPQYIDGERCGPGSRVRYSRQRAETYIGAASVYRMTPCTEEEANRLQPGTVEILEKAREDGARLLGARAAPWNDDICADCGLFQDDCQC